MGREVSGGDPELAEQLGAPFTVFKYTESIQKNIYTTNAVEGYHRQVRKVTKTKGAFTTDMTLLKLVYLTTMNIQKK